MMVGNNHICPIFRDTHFQITIIVIIYDFYDFLFHFLNGIGFENSNCAHFEELQPSEFFTEWFFDQQITVINLSTIQETQWLKNSLLLSHFSERSDIRFHHQISSLYFS